MLCPCTMYKELFFSPKSGASLNSQPLINHGLRKKLPRPLQTTPCTGTAVTVSFPGVCAHVGTPWRWLCSVGVGAVQSDDEVDHRKVDAGMRTSSFFEAERKRQLLEFAENSRSNKLEARPTLGGCLVQEREREVGGWESVGEWEGGVFCVAVTRQSALPL
jgi:hypothetical protein